MDIEAILQQLEFQNAHIKSVNGGDINEAFCINADGRRYFLKLNEARFSGLFEKEFHGLAELRANSDFIIPNPLRCGIIGRKQYLLLEWIDEGIAHNDSWLIFGRQLAAMHMKKQHYFGFYENNFLATWPQNNEQCASWGKFYINFRVKPLVKQLFDDGKFDKSYLKHTQILERNIELFFPEEPPSLLHGDLWNGNKLFTKAGMPCIYDPAVYYGHREMDIAMTLLFGGFPPEFYHSYNECYPLTSGWRQRLPVAQLYALLLHAHLFGGHYVQECKKILSVFN